MNVHSLSMQDSNHSESNPLLAGIKLVTTEAEMLPLIARNPFWDAAWRRQNQDIDLFRSYMQQVVVPTRTALRVGVAVHKILKVSLHQQDPRRQENRRQYFQPAVSLADGQLNRGIHDGMSILGVTGVGKSHLLFAALSRIPRRIERTDIPEIDRIVQVVWMYIDMTAVPSVEALARRLIDEIDFILGRNGQLANVTLKGLNSATAKMQAAIRLLKTHYCGLIVFDEIQHSNLAVATAAPLREWILRIANVGTGVVFSGNPLGFRLRMPAQSRKSNSSDEKKVYSTQLMRRLFAADEIRVDPALAYNDKGWIFFTKAINSCRLAAECHPYDPELEQLKFQKTGGFADFYVELHCVIEAMLANAKTKNRIVDKELIEEAALRSSKLVKMRPMIDAFVRRDVILLRQCSDVDYDYYQELWRSNDDLVVGASQPLGPSGVVVMPEQSVNIEKSLQEDRRIAEGRIKRNRAKSKEQPNPAAEAVRAGHLEGLESIITGKKRNAES